LIGLAGLWTLSLVLSLAALAIMAGLIVARMVSARRSATRKAFRDQLVPRLLEGAPDAEIERLPQARTLLAQIAGELISIVRGDERDQFVATATRLGVAETLARQLRRGSHRERILAAESLAHFPDDRTTDALDAALDDRSADVRLTAALALASSGRSPPLAALVERLRLGISEQSMLLVTLIQEIARERPEESRALLLDPAAPATLKAAAIDALSGSGDYSLVPVIARLAVEAPDDAPELPRYLRALGQLHHPAARPAIVRGLASRTWFVRAAAAEAAGRIGLADLLHELEDLLDDGDWWVRYRAGEAIARLGEQGRRRLAVVSKAGSPRAREVARLSLVEQGALA
jgi:HEAT repeat protein